MTDVAATLFALSSLLVVVSLLPRLATQLSLPLGVLLVALGIALGIGDLALARIVDSGPLADGMNALGRLDLNASTFLYVFLPLLLFAGALSLDVRRLFDDIGPILLLAVVAVMICTAFVGYALHWSFEVPLLVALLIGSVVATTDLSAVLGVLRDLGVPRRLSILIEGESLFNDAAAIAIFGLLLGILVGEREGGLAEVVLGFLTAFLGGIAVGYLLARLVCVLVGWLGDAPLAEVTLTLALAYLSYLFCEVYFHVSGVVAVCTSALVIASYGRTRISAAAWDVLQAIWSQLEFWAISLIFILAAMMVPRLLADPHLQELAMLAVLIAATLLARGLVLYGLLPGLGALRLAEPIKHQYRTVILWGGLRGAITLVLALSVTQNAALPAEVRHLVGVLATGFVLFTLFVNAPTMKPLLRALGLDRLDPKEQAIRDRVMALSNERLRREVADSALDYGLDPATVARMKTLFPPQTCEGDEVSAALDRSDLLQIGLATLASREGELYMLHLNDRTVSRQLAQLAIADAGRLSDGVKTGGLAGYQAAAAKALQPRGAFRLALLLHTRFGWQDPLARSLALQFEGLLAAQSVLRELGDFNRRALTPLVGEPVARDLAGLIEARQQATRQALAAFELQYPTYAEALKVSNLGRLVLRREEDEYRLKRAESLVTHEVYQDLRRDLRRRRQALERRPSLDLGMRLAEMVAKVPLFQDLTAQELSEVVRLLKPRLAIPGERLITAGGRGDEMFFIAAGAVEVAVPGSPVRLAAGSFFGELALLTRRPRTAHVTALGYCHLLVLEGRDFRRFLRAHPAIAKGIEAIAEARLVEVGAASDSTA